MEVTLESLQKNKEIYNENIKKILQDRAELMKQVTELRRTRESLIDEIDIAKLDFEESKLVQQINDLTSVFKGNTLTLEQLGLQQDILESKIDRETYSKCVVANRKAKADLSKEQELMYCENEVKKCEKALKLYTLIGDKDNIAEWQKALSKAEESLEYAQLEINKGRQTEEKTLTNPIRRDGTIENVPKSQTGYSMDENGSQYTEKQHQALKDYSGKEIGSRTIIWNTDMENGIQYIETIGSLENDDGKYSMKEVSKGVGDELQFHKKELNIDNKITGEREELSYQKDEKCETFSKRLNGQMTFKITSTDKGISIDEYRNGQPYATYEYDKDGKAIEGMGMSGIDQLDENYTENFFDSQVPYFEAENKKIPIQNIDGQTLLDSAIEATEESTRTSTINTQAENIKQLVKTKDEKSKGMEIE